MSARRGLAEEIREDDIAWRSKFTSALLRELRIHFTTMGKLDKAKPRLEKLREIAKPNNDRPNRV
jgi:hypothetical protein